MVAAKVWWLLFVSCSQTKTLRAVARLSGEDQLPNCSLFQSTWWCMSLSRTNFTSQKLSPILQRMDLLFNFYKRTYFNRVKDVAYLEGSDATHVAAIVPWSWTSEEPQKILHGEEKIDLERSIETERYWGCGQCDTLNNLIEMLWSSFRLISAVKI